MKISVVMTSYNYEYCIRDAIESVINQTYKDWELIIVDDASTDNSVGVIKQYLNDSRIKLFVNPKNLGLSASLQRGIKEVSGNWIAFLESDDIFEPNSLEEKVKAISTGADLIFTELEMFGDEEKIHKYKTLYFRDVEEFLKLEQSGFVENFADIIIRTNVIPTFSVVMLKKKLLKNCDFNPVCKASLDYYLWAQLADRKIYFLKKKLTKWHMHPDSYINRDKNNWLKKFLFKISLYSKTIKNKNALIKLLLLINYIRARLIYFKINRNVIKINIANDAFIYEKFLK